MYRLPLIVASEMGVLRTSPLFHPRTESKCCDPILRPHRNIATFSRTIHIGGGFTSDMLGEYAGPFLFRCRPSPLVREYIGWPERRTARRAVANERGAEGQGFEPWIGLHL